MLRYRRRKKGSRLASLDGEKAGGSETDGRVGDSVEICDEFEKMGKDEVHEVHGIAVPARSAELPASEGMRAQELPA